MADVASDTGDSDISVTPSSGQRAPADDAANDDDESAADDADAPLPPDAGFRAFFSIRIFRTDGQAGGMDSEGVAGDGDSPVTLHDDGSFEVHLPPGRYGLEATSNDGYLAGGRDIVNAGAGDAEDGLDVVLDPTVVLAGRVLDEDGVLVPATVTVSRVGSDGSAVTSGDGTFRFDELRPGLFQVTAETGEDQPATGTFFAPTDNVVLHVARAGAGLLILPRAPDGRCVRAGVTAARREQNPSSGAPKAVPRLGAKVRWRTRFRDCQVVIEPVAPGSEWDLLVTLIESTPIGARVRFGYESPAAPICLRAGCPTAVAALQVVPIDVDGHVIALAATVIDSPPGGPAVGSSIHELATGLPANQGITIEVRAGAMQIRRQLWLLPGVNRAVIQFPVHADDIPEGQVVTMQ